MLILGLGAIARRLIELLGPLKMHLMAVRQTSAAMSRFGVYPATELDRILPQADHVVNILPSGNSTNQLMDARRFSLMQPTAVFYNIGRGSTVAQIAMAEALKSNKLAAAYLDVTDPEPLPADHFLWTTPNCHITPHTAGGCSVEFRLRRSHFLDNLGRFESNSPLRDGLCERMSRSKQMLAGAGRYVVADPYPFVLDLAKCHGSWLVTLEGREIFDWAGYFGANS